MIVRLLREGYALRGKRLSLGPSVAARLFAWMSAIVVGAACVAMSGCDGNRDDRAALTSATDAVPMLPGVDRAGASSAAAAAQQFDTQSNVPEQGASAGPGALLPPVIHTAD